MKLIQRITNSTLAKPTTLVSLVSILAVFGPFISVSGGFWDAVNHLVNEPEYFWSIQHIVVYFGVSLVASAGFLSVILLIKKSVHGILKTGKYLIFNNDLIRILDLSLDVIIFPKLSNSNVSAFKK